MIALIQTELRKLNGSLALLLAMVTPALPGLLVALALLSSQRDVQISTMLTGFVLPIWCLFLWPMTIAAFTTLTAQIEHRARGWDHLLSLPLARWQVFLVKAGIVLTVSALMTVLAVIFTWLGALVGGVITGHPPLGVFPWNQMIRTVALLSAGTTMLVVLQLWAAIRFASFVVPLVVGIAGTLVAMAVAMTRTDQASWFPWVLPFKIVTSADPTPFALFGLASGVGLLGLMVSDLSRRTFR